MSQFSPEDAYGKCSFCGKKREQVRKIINGPGVCICDECVDLSVEILDEELDRKAPPEPFLARVEVMLRAPGLQAAGRRLAAVVERHLKGAAQSPVLLAGASGTGKTTLVRALAEAAPVPLAVLDLAASPPELTHFDLHPLFRRVIMAAEYDARKAERAIVVLEGLDTPGREGLQWELLHILDSARVAIPSAESRAHPYQDYVGLETRGMLFVGVVRSEEPELIPPLAARFARCVRLHEPTVEDVLAMMGAEDSPWSTLLRHREGKVAEGLDRAVAEFALSLGLGGWGLRHVVADLEDVLDDRDDLALDARALEEVRTRRFLQA